MWTALARFTLRNRMIILVFLALATVFMGYQATYVKLDYNLPRLLPEKDQVNLDYENFVEVFGSHGNVVVVGIQDEKLYELEHFNAWFDMGNQIKEIEGVEEIVSVTHAYNLIKNKEKRVFDMRPVVENKPTTQQELDSLKNVILSLEFYDGVVYNKETGATLMAITINKELINSKKRKGIIYTIRDVITEFESEQGLDVRYSGLPYIRTGITVLLKREMKLFTVLAALLAALILYLFFRSFQVVFFSLIVVSVGVIWSIGSLTLLDYKITGLSGLIPPLIIVIGITNCIYLLNKYHHEYRGHGSRERALIRVVQKIGSATFMTNATTAIGFATFILTGSQVLFEFGTVASLNIMLVFALSILMIPIIFSYLDPPKEKHTKHLDYKTVGIVIEAFVKVVNNNRRFVYMVTWALVIVGIYGLTKVETTGNLADDLPRNDPARIDLRFFEQHFGGVMPFEILIDTKKERGVMKLSNIQKIDRLHKVIESYPEFSAPISLAEMVKFSKQAFYNGRASKYSLPNQQEKNFILPYASKEMKEKKLIHSLVDSTRQIARVSVRMADVGTKEMQEIQDHIRPRIDSVFDPEKYNVMLTGTSVVYLKGTEYLVKGLMISLLLAVFLISLVMAGMFHSFRMVLVSLVPNLIPLLLTAAIMGYFGISIKPSTILVFSIALGISVDNTIHFLAKYRQELKHFDYNIKKAVNAALRETGVSMIYTSNVLLFGFGIFIASSFGGTQALGMLVTITLLLAVLSNLLFLPSLLLSLEKSFFTKAFKDPLIEVFDEEEDIDLHKLEVPKESNE